MDRQVCPHHECVHPPGHPSHDPGRAGPRPKGLSGRYPWCLGTLWTLRTELRSSGSYGPAGQAGCSRHVSSKPCAEFTVSYLSAAGHSTATLLCCQGHIYYIHMNGVPRVAPTPWHPERSHVSISSPQRPFISGVPRERTLHSVRKTYMISSCKL